MPDVQDLLKSVETTLDTLKNYRDVNLQLDEAIKAKKIRINQILAKENDDEAEKHISDLEIANSSKVTTNKKADYERSVYTDYLFAYYPLNIKSFRLKVINEGVEFILGMKVISVTTKGKSYNLCYPIFASLLNFLLCIKILEIFSFKL